MYTITGKSIYFILTITFVFSSLIFSQNTNLKAREKIKFGYSSKTLQEIEPRDAEAALIVLVKYIAEGIGYYTDVEVTFYSDIQELENDVRNKKLDVVILLGHDYLKLKNRISLEPFAVPIKNNSVFCRLIFITNKENPLNTFSHSNNNNLLISVSRNNEFPGFWIDRVLSKKYKLRSDNIFSDVEEVIKPSLAVFPVFFKKSSAAIILDTFYEVICELNPQIKKNLVVEEISPPVIISVLCYTGTFDNEEKRLMKKSILDLKNNKEGKQILGIFKIDDFTDFQPQYLEGIQSIVSDK